MFTSNPFAGISSPITPIIMQTYVLLMFILVVVGTLFDITHKKSARYFFDTWRSSKEKAQKNVDGAKMLSIAAETVVIDVMASGEFCNMRRRIAHLLTMYGFVIYIVTTVIMVFAYPTASTPVPASIPVLWYIGALMVCFGGYWFWFFIRVDVAAEGNVPLRFVRADLFIVALVLSVSFGLVWALVQTNGPGPYANMFLGLYLLATTVLFGSIPWSKFSHMFFKPAAALQKRVSEADGTRRNLPSPVDAPKIYGGGVKRVRHY